MMLFSKVAKVATVTILASLTLGLVSCSQSGAQEGQGQRKAENSESSSVPTFKVVPEAAQLVPKPIAEAGTVTVAIPTNEPPTQFYREGTKEMTGINPDIARLIAGALGLDLKIEVANFDSIIPGIEAGRYDMTVSSMTPTQERIKVLDFVEYVKMGNALLTKSGNPQELDYTTLCGKRVAVLTGSYQLTVRVPEMNAECTESGMQEIEIQQFQDTRQAVSSVVSDRSDVVFADGPILHFAASQTPDVEVVAEAGIDPVAVGIAKESGMLDAVKVAMDTILQSEEYRAVLATYGVESIAIDDAKVNVPQ